MTDPTTEEAIEFMRDWYKYHNFPSQDKINLAIRALEQMREREKYPAPNDPKLGIYLKHFKPRPDIMINALGQFCLNYGSGWEGYDVEKPFEKDKPRTWDKVTLGEVAEKYPKANFYQREGSWVLWKANARAVGESILSGKKFPKESPLSTWRALT